MNNVLFDSQFSHPGFAVEKDVVKCGEEMDYMTLYLSRANLFDRHATPTGEDSLFSSMADQLMLLGYPISNSDIMKELLNINMPTLTLIEEFSVKFSLQVLLYDFRAKQIIKFHPKKSAIARLAFANNRFFSLAEESFKSFPIQQDYLKLCEQIKQMNHIVQNNVMADPDIKEYFEKVYGSRFKELLEVQSSFNESFRDQYVGFVGAMRSGKSTLVNALLGSKVLPGEGGGQSVTATVTDIFRADTKGFNVVIQLDTLATIEAELDMLREYASDEKRGGESYQQYYENLEYCIEPTDNSPVKKNILASWKRAQTICDIENDCFTLNEGVKKLLRSNRCVQYQFSSMKVLAEALNDILTETGYCYIDQPVPFWAISSRVIVYGPFETLPYNVHLVDLPGIFDSNTAKSRRTEDYYHKCDLVAFVSIASASFSEQGLSETLQKLLRFKKLSNVMFCVTQADLWLATRKPVQNFWKRALECEKKLKTTLDIILKSEKNELFKGRSSNQITIHYTSSENYFNRKYEEYTGIPTLKKLLYDISRRNSVVWLKELLTKFIQDIKSPPQEEKPRSSKLDDIQTTLKEMMEEKESASRWLSGFISKILFAQDFQGPVQKIVLTREWNSFPTIRYGGRPCAVECVCRDKGYFKTRSKKVDPHCQDININRDIVNGFIHHFDLRSDFQRLFGGNTLFTKLVMQLRRTFDSLSETSSLQSALNIQQQQYERECTEDRLFFGYSLERQVCIWLNSAYISGFSSRSMNPVILEAETAMNNLRNHMILRLKQMCNRVEDFYTTVENLCNATNSEDRELSIKISEMFNSSLEISEPSERKLQLFQPLVSSLQIYDPVVDLLWTNDYFDISATPNILQRVVDIRRYLLSNECSEVRLPIIASQLETISNKILSIEDGRSRLVAQELVNGSYSDLRALSSSYRYQESNFLDFVDSTVDSFYDQGRGRPFKSAIELLMQPVSENDREVILVFKNVDTELQEFLKSVKTKLERCCSKLEAYEIIAKLVDERMPYNPTTHSSSLHALKKKFDSNVIPIGEITNGVCRHRSILFKVVCDELQDIIYNKTRKVSDKLMCRLVRGKKDKPHAWNIVEDESHQMYLVDVMQSPGQLYHEDSPIAKEYQRNNGTIGGRSLHGEKRCSKALVLDSAHIIGSSNYFVYKGIYNNEECAVKVVPKHKVNFELFYMRYIHHPNIVSLKHFEAKDDNFNLVMNYMGTYKQFSGHIYHQKDGDQLFWIIIYLLKVAQGIAFLHSRNIMHRDIKPDNILLSRNLEDIMSRDGELEVQIADLGITKHWEKDNSFAGTPLYLAPEILEKKPYSLNVDCFSFGITMSGLLKMNNSDAVIPKRIRSKLTNLFDRCVKKDPEERIASSQIVSTLSEIVVELLE